MEMTLQLLLIIAFLFMMNMFLQSSYAAHPNSLSKGSSLSVEKPNHDVLMSSNGVFAAGFRSVGDNAYCFAIWFAGSSDLTIVWMANRDRPVNGKGSVLSLLGDGNLVLKDIGEIKTWATDTNSPSQVELIMLDTGNLVLQTLGNEVLWESFKFPTDTLLPYQQIDRYTKLVSSRSHGDYSSGAYWFYFDNDNMLHLLYDGPQTSSLYWPGPTTCYPPDRYKYNSSRIAFFDAAGQFQSSDQYTFIPTDLGVGPKRRLTIDFDGNLKMYSLQEKEKKWIASWQALNQPCRIHGICGANSVCIQGHGRRYCSCLPAFKAKNDYDWTAGCEPQFNQSFDVRESIFVRLPNVDFYGFDIGSALAQSLKDCKHRCVQLNNTCKAVMYRNGTCYLKSQLSNGVQTLNFQGTAYVMLPESSVRFYNDSGDEKSTQLNCSGSTNDVHQLEIVYPQNRGSRFSLYLLWFVAAMGGVEMLCIFIGCFCLYQAQRRHIRRVVQQGYLLVLAGFRKFSYKELEKATRGFSQEIGRGGGGIVYKVTWVREKINASSADDMASTIEEIMDTRVDAQYFVAKMEVLIKVALQCVQEDKDERPSMSKVVEMLTHHETM
ncbi:hypothetical protein Scep_002990 [Stephania cephalantha]|uniref:Uncharacterized protein n=1 Tax=Stephania cephalantha TaxID=152367 RepID=A0AAP0Q6D0_9MAGN